MISKLKTAVEEAAQTEDKPNRIYTTKEEAIQRCNFAQKSGKLVLH